MKGEEVLLVTVQSGEEVMASIGRQLADRGVTDGAVVSLIGAVDSCGFSTMAPTNHRDNRMTEVEQPVELSGTGEVKGGRLHIHCVINVERGVTYGGHLHWANVDHHFVNAYVVPL